jgi:hypothetical protein
MKIIYHGLFVDDMYNLQRMFAPVFPNLFYHHMTIEFAPKDASNIVVGRRVGLQVIGRLTTNKVDALLVEYSGSKNKYPHITLSTAEGVKPFESNAEFEKYPQLINRFGTSMIVATTEGYFNGHDVTELK